VLVDTSDRARYTGVGRVVGIGASYEMAVIVPGDVSTLS
jgi:hypothetical protein